MYCCVYFVDKKWNDCSDQQRMWRVPCLYSGELHGSAAPGLRWSSDVGSLYYRSSGDRSAWQRPQTQVSGVYFI